MNILYLNPKVELSGILRTVGAKYIYDYRDKNVDFLEKLYKNRQKYYKKIM